MVITQLLEVKMISYSYLYASTKYVHEGLILVTLGETINKGVPKSCLCLGTISILCVFNLACPLVGLTVTPHGIHTISKRADALPHGLPMSVST
jgi:hypothetical protein